jgi:plasmid stabilization system protein ParE
LGASYYLVHPERLTVVRVLHSKRDIGRLLEGQDLEGQDVADQ